MSQFNAPHFQSHEAAREYLEGLRWGSDRVCPHCGTVNESFLTKKPGVYRCRTKECRKDFSVTTKSVMESSHIKLHIWLQAFFLMASSKKGISSHQIHRALGITYKSAWFLTHRIREAMRAGGLLPPMGGGGKAVEVDETFYGRLEGAPKKGRHAWANKNVVLTLVERGGAARSFHIDGVRAGEILPIIKANLSREAQMITDEMYSNKYIAEVHRHQPPSRQPIKRRIRSPRGREGHFDQHGRRLLLDFQARYEGRLSALQREAPSPLSL